MVGCPSPLVGFPSSKLDDWLAVLAQPPGENRRTAQRRRYKKARAVWSDWLALGGCRLLGYSRRTGVQSPHRSLR